MYIKETYVNCDENHIISETDHYEPYTNNIGELFRSLSKEYGRCLGKMYIDRKTHSRIHSYPIGYIFEKRIKYQDCNEYYIQHVWVEFFACKTVNNKYIHKYIDR